MYTSVRRKLPWRVFFLIFRIINRACLLSFTYLYSSGVCAKKGDEEEEEEEASDDDESVDEHDDTPCICRLSNTNPQD